LIHWEYTKGIRGERRRKRGEEIESPTQKPKKNT
jgi:hypothetical protein